jgi:predicted  nucleic acid-binding Zn-ribbon protein
MLAPFVLAGASCDNNNQSEVNALRAQAQQSQTEVNVLKGSVANLSDRIGRLEAQPQSKELPAAATQNSQGGNAAAINKAIADCVRKVRSLETQPKDSGGQLYAEFDAFYNQGSGRVEDNNRYVDRGPNYAFNKCMSSKGVPLTY